MRSKYEQIKYIEKWNMKIIIHYSSWRLNYELPQDKVNEQLRLEQLDIKRAILIVNTLNKLKSFFILYNFLSFILKLFIKIYWHYIYTSQVFLNMLF